MALQPRRSCRSIHLKSRMANLQQWSKILHCIFDLLLLSVFIMPSHQPSLHHFHSHTSSPPQFPCLSTSTSHKSPSSNSPNSPDQVPVSPLTMSNVLLHNQHHPTPPPAHQTSTVPSFSITNPFHVQADINDKIKNNYPFIRFFHHNINGIQSTKTDFCTDQLHQNLVEAQASIYSLNEVNIDFVKPEVKRSFIQQTKKWDKHSHLSISTSPDQPTKYLYKPGGTVLGVTGPWSNRVESSGTDTCGSFSWTTLRGHRNHRVLCISAYRVSQESKSGLTLNAVYMQEHRALLKQGISSPKPKQRVLQALSDLISKFRSNSKYRYSVILMMDSNESCTKEDSKISIIDEHAQQRLLCCWTTGRAVMKIDHGSNSRVAEKAILR